MPLARRRLIRSRLPLILRFITPRRRRYCRCFFTPAHASLHVYFAGYEALICQSAQQRAGVRHERGARAYAVICAKAVKGAAARAPTHV